MLSPQKITCHAPGDRCPGCAHYRGTAPICELASTDAAKEALLREAAGDLLDALEMLLTHTVDADLAAGFALTEGEQEARDAALAAIAKARGVA